ncbi:hypothetical protein HUT19_14765 [Streptomyces sp. NA02950]|uniref:hypothetical protein n=1 Tax=Streptomyces sp. NA02950 TaxID=2742137 RepID=UPI001591BE5A|nr:hypothetical protein [Streptomyces sp. NA02950]QKV92860.1 hypothetical protein HUT19_14765 [Streptomyces sp. NA02950]
MGKCVTAVRRMMAEAVGLELPEPQLVGAARVLVTELARPDVLRGLITELAGGEGDPAACARRSYRHVLGFEKLLLIDGGPRQTLRLHVWHPTGGSADREDIHNHRSPLASYVVRGRLRMELYERSVGTGITTTAYRETLSDNGTDWLLTPRGPARLSLTHTAQYAAGASYALPAHTLHRAWCDPGDSAITLFLETGSGRLVHTDVFSPSTHHPATVRKVAFTEEAYLTALASLTTSLETVRNNTAVAGPLTPSTPGTGN